jgi:plastocyanin
MSSRIALLTLLAALLLPSSLAQAQANPRLVASVGANDAFVITLRDANGNAVTNLAPGTYDIAVSDLSTEHNFHLTGPNVDQTTPVGARQEVTWTVTFSDGRYTFVCDAHPTQMRGSFTVGTAPPPPPPPARLTATVGPRKTISLRSTAGRVRTIAAGPVIVAVNDRTRLDNFHLTGPGVNRKTGVAFRGRATWRLTLQAGRYTYRSDRTRRLRGTFTVTPSA